MQRPDDKSLESLVFVTIADVLGLQDSELSPTTDLEMEYGADSLDRIEIAESIERSLEPLIVGFEIPDEALESFDSPGGVIRVLTSLLNDWSSAANDIVAKDHGVQA